MLIDTHAHLNFKAFKHDLDEVIKHAAMAEVEKIIIPGARLSSSRKAVKIAQANPSCFAAVGIHPHHIDKICTPPVIPNLSRDPNEILKQVQNDKISELARLTTQPKVVAIGEIGLDYYHYSNSSPISDLNKQIQKRLFLLQLELALKMNLSVILHCRQAYDDLLELLESFLNNQNKNICGVFHCFQGRKKHLQKALNLGFYIGFDGNITYTENSRLRNLVKMTPLDRLLLETDSPFLTPIPFRGNRNEPSFLPHIALMVTKIKEEKSSIIAETTSNNALRLFNL